MKMGYELENNDDEEFPSVFEILRKKKKEEEE